MINFLKFGAVILVGFLAMIYLIILTYIYFNQERMIFQPVKLDKNYKFSYPSDFEEMTISSFDGEKLNGLLFKTEKSKGLIFYLHGNFGALDSWGTIAKTYTDLGYDIFILDYRGFGKSEGKIESEKQFYKDVTAAYQFVSKRYPENKTVIVGYSIGTGSAAYLASKQHPKALILQSPYYNFSELCGSKIPFVPEFLKKYKFATNVFIPEIKRPVYIFHGENDEVIPFENGQKLQKLLKSGSRFYPLRDQDHIGMNENPVYQSTLKLILTTLKN